MSVTEWVDVLGQSPWLLVLLYVATTVDGVFPPVPSEAVVIALAALPADGGRPTVWLLGAVAAVGAFTGDQVAYSLGRHAPIRRLRALRWARAGTALTWAEGAFARRGAAIVLGARFVPAGRVAVNMTAGAVRMPRGRFSLCAGVAAVLWAIYTVLLGMTAGHLLDDRHPLLGAAVAVPVGLLIGVVVDAVLRRVLARRSPPHAAGAGPTP